MKNFLNLFRHYIFTYDWEVVELMGALFKITWGIWLLLPFDSFRAGMGITKVSTENIWGVSLLILGSFHLWAIKSRRLRPRRIMAFTSFLFWIFTIIIVVQASPTSPLIPFFGVIAFYMALNYMRIGITLETAHRKVKELIEKETGGRNE